MVKMALVLQENRDLQAREALQEPLVYQASRTTQDQLDAQGHRSQDPRESEPPDLQEM